MASPARSRPASSEETEEQILLKPGHGLPGHTVDALLAQGKVAEARVELERLIQEGIDSGIDPRSAEEVIESIRAEIRTRTAAGR